MIVRGRKGRSCLIGLPSHSCSIQGRDPVRVVPIVFVSLMMCEIKAWRTELENDAHLLDQLLSASRTDQSCRLQLSQDPSPASSPS